MMRTTCSHLIAAALFAQLVTGAGCKSPTQPVVEEEQAPLAENVVELSTEAISRNGIQLAEVASHSLEDLIEAPAEIQLNPDRVAHVEPLVAGQLRRVDVSIGEQVEAGQRLAVLRSVELGRARAEYHRTIAMLDAAQLNFARQERLRTEGISSERSYLEAKLRQAEAEAEQAAARARLLVFGLDGGDGPDMPIVAPITGTIVRRHGTQGENVGPDDTLFMIADTAKVWVVAHVYERDMSKVRVGANAYLTLQAQPDVSWEGKITFVAPIVDETTRTLSVRTDLDNEDGSLRPGLFGRLRIAAGEPLPVVAIPETALQVLYGETVVFVPAGGSNKFRAKGVTAGRRSDGLIEIREGLSLGSKVVVAGAFLLKSQLMADEFGEEE